MARQDWEREIEIALRRENWALKGPNRIVKVRPIGQDRKVASSGLRLGGYFTVAKSLVGMTPEMIEAGLGLSIGSLKRGALIYSFKRLPTANEYDYELSTEHPGGQAATFMSDPAYPPGSKKIHQWAIKEGVTIPVDEASVVRLTPNERFRS